MVANDKEYDLKKLSYSFSSYPENFQLEIRQCNQVITSYLKTHHFFLDDSDSDLEISFKTGQETLVIHGFIHEGAQLVRINEEETEKMLNFFEDHTHIEMTAQNLNGEIDTTDFKKHMKFLLRRSLHFN